MSRKYIESRNPYEEQDIGIFKSRGQITSNGVTYDDKSTSARYNYILLRESHHTDEILHEAKKELRGDKRLITLKVYRIDRQ